MHISNMDKSSKDHRVVPHLNTHVTTSKICSLVSWLATYGCLHSLPYTNKIYDLNGWGIYGSNGWGIYCFREMLKNTGLQVSTLSDPRMTMDFGRFELPTLVQFSECRWPPLDVPS